MSLFDCLPAYELCRSPRVIAAFDTDFLRNLDAFSRALGRGEKFTILLQTGWSVLEPKFGAELVAKTTEARKVFPEARIIYLVNEKEAIGALKDFAECVLCHQNAFLDPKRYPVSGGGGRYDAIYVARITPFKRHNLASKVGNLHLVGSHSRLEQQYFEETLRNVPHARWDEKVNSWRVGSVMGRARCGLALSAIEGAMFVCGEYSLCGLPVVNTANIGGRDLMLPEFAAYRAEDTPESVAEGVAHWLDNPVPPQEIRSAFLSMAAGHRAVLDDLLALIAGRRIAVPHKLGVRCRLLPHQKLLHGIRRR